jgi:putative transposase
LWHNRVYSCPLSGGRHLRLAPRYVDLNPIRAGMVGEAEHDRCSSARAHLRGRDALDLLDVQVWEALDLQAVWGGELRSGGEASAELPLRPTACSGRPLGDRDFLRQIEAQLRRRLWTAGPGRPKKEQGRVAGRAGCLLLRSSQSML